MKVKNNQTVYPGNFSREFEYLTEFLKNSDKNVSDFLDKKTVSVIISGNEIIGSNSLDGVSISKIESSEEDVLHYRLEITDGVVLERPVHICTGDMRSTGVQKITTEIIVGDDSKVSFLSHCSFPKGDGFKHVANMMIKIGENSMVEYLDEHMHSMSGGTSVISDTKASVGKNSQFANTFSLSKTRSGDLEVNMDVEVLEFATANMLSKIKASQNDRVKIHEVLKLKGKNSTGMAKSDIVALDDSNVEVYNEAYGIGENSTGHVDCDEITKGNGVIVSTVPILKIFTDSAELTHEASIGRINKKQLENLLAKGLDEEEATDFIVKGILK